MPKVYARLVLLSTGLSHWHLRLSNGEFWLDSEEHRQDLQNEFMLAPDEQLTHLTNLTGETEKEALRSDTVHFDLPVGGSVFALGSITFCGCLPWDNFDNNVSQLLENILRNKLSG